MKKIRIAEISAAVALIVAVIASVAGFGVRCGDVREDVIRLHILANSDSEEDQNVKLIVRDALLNSGK
ncbi:MAG: stage II sporulation protein R, partial [Oscillospiraceae bacterium]|nr:stage II sporulation protein R [Oscillospiraceae bacterium]